MPFCPSCGAPVREEDAACPACGANLRGEAPEPVEYHSTFGPKIPEAPSGAPKTWREAMARRDRGGFLWMMLSLCVPFVGLPLYFIWRKKKPNRASDLKMGLIMCLICMLMIFLAALWVGLTDGAK